MIANPVGPPIVKEVALVATTGASVNAIPELFKREAELTPATTPIISAAATKKVVVAIPTPPVPSAEAKLIFGCLKTSLSVRSAVAAGAVKAMILC